MHILTIIKIIVVVVALSIFAGSTIGFMTESYSEYMEYYQSVMADREYQKYVESQTMTFDGLSVTLNDGVTYYATGKARPKKDDLTVIAHFSEKGKAVDKILDNSEYDIVVPTDFSENGGSVVVKYLYQPEKAEDATEDPTPIMRTAELDIKLTPVVLTAVKLINAPYRVYYSDNMSFDMAGIKLEASFNSGEKVILDASDLKAASQGNLVSGTESVKVSYTHGEVTVDLDVSVKVVPAAEYNDGDIVDIRAEGSTLVLDGQNLADAKPTIRATYRNGNRLIISSDNYTVSGFTEKASFFNSCIVKVALKSNPNVTCTTSAAVRYVAEAENATASEGTIKSAVTDANGASVQVLENITNGNTISFVVNSDAIAKGKFTLRIASTADRSLKLTDLLAFKINGRYLLVPSAITLEAWNNGYSFIECTLPDIVINKGANTVELIFGGMDGFTLAVDSLGIETKYDGIISSDTEEHIINSFNAGITPELTAEMVKDFHSVTNGLYIHGLCTDGKYIYVSRTTDLEEDKTVRCIMVSKYDANTYELIASAPLSADASCETNAGITYYDGKIIIYYNDGTKWYIDPSLEGEWTEYTGFNFEGTEGKAIRDVYYDSTTDRFAVLTGERITICGNDMKAITSFDVKSKTSTFYITRMTGTSDYLYVGFTKDGVYNLTVQVYDWNGNYVGMFTVTSPTGVTSSTNIQGLVFVNGDIIFTQIRWATKGSAFVKVSYPEVNAVLDYDLTIGEYIAATKDKGVTASATASAADGNFGKISVTGIYSMGGAYDGEYLYVSMSGNSDNLFSIISKVDPATLKVVGETVNFTVSEVKGDNSRIFLKDGKLYCITADGSMFEINVDSLNGVGCNVTKSTLSFAQYGTAFDATWCEETGKFVLLTNDKKLHILGEDLSASVKNIALSNGSAAPSSVTCDDKYIYVSYKASATVPIDVYTWDGEKVGSVSVTGFDLGAEISFNVQAIFFMDGEMHASVCSWSKSHLYYHDWVVEINEDDLK